MDHTQIRIHFYSKYYKKTHNIIIFRFFSLSILLFLKITKISEYDFPINGRVGELRFYQHLSEIKTSFQSKIVHNPTKYQIKQSNNGEWRIQPNT